jgi:hypothetical protein
MTYPRLELEIFGLAAVVETTVHLRRQVNKKKISFLILTLFFMLIETNIYLIVLAF